MRFDIITVMPQMLDAITHYGVTSRAVQKGLIQVKAWNPRKHTSDVHQTVDDRPYGGGPGMVMKPEPLLATVNEIKTDVASAYTQSSDCSANGGNEEPKVIYLSPQGKRFEQRHAQALAEEGRPLVFLAGRYEGVDERLIDLVVDEEYSIGDYVLSGGELGAMVMIDAIARLLPNVLGHSESAQQDSFTDGLLDCPHYTRPELFEGQAVPSVLLSGNHAAIDCWRREQALLRTQARRPDLFDEWVKKDELSDQDHLLLNNKQVK